MLPLEIKIDLNVLNHLGMSLYSNTPAVLTEIISNAWDADAKEVNIELDPANGEVTISDDGHGMSREDIIHKFLNVGYARRKDNRHKSDNLKRQVMGRKGIGKLAMFSLANKIQITSKKQDHVAQSFEIDVLALQKSIESKSSYNAKELIAPDNFSTGTVIKLYELKKSIDKTENYLRKRLARRFSVIGDTHDFKVLINKTPIETNDREFLADIEFLWELSKSEPERIKSCKDLQKKEVLEGVIEYGGNKYYATGYIGSVKKPGDLKKDAEISNNTITIIANGRVFQEDILAEFGSAKVFTNYLVGEIILDFLDDNTLPDMATSSRQQLQQTDPRYIILKAFFTTALSKIDKQWDEWRREKGVKEAESYSPALSDWLKKFKGHERRAAEKLIGTVNTFRFSGSEEEQNQARKGVLKNSVLAFEKLRIKNNLVALDTINDIDSIHFKDIFSSVDDIEASLFYEITSQRLEIIEKFQEITDENQLERAVQEYLYEHLWLLDPSWERVTGETHIEQTLTKELKEINPSSSGARIDIAYKTMSGKHVIIEMKRPKVFPDILDLVKQGKKYIDATTQWYVNNPKSCANQIPHIQVIFLLGKGYLDDGGDQHFLINQLQSVNASILTYSDLITQSRQAYEEYNKQSKEAARIRNIIDSI